MKILIAGLGSIGQRHVRNLRAVLGNAVDIVAYRVRRLPGLLTANMQTDPSRDVEREYNIRSFDNLASALAEKPSVAFITNPSSMHVPVALACARAGCDLFLEKPVSNNMDGIPELLQEVSRRGLVAMVGYQLRFHPALRALSEILDSRVLGNLLAVRATIGEYLPAWHPYEDYRQMYASRASLGGGVILSQIHEFDYLYSLFGAPRRLYSLGGHHSSLEIDVEDVASTLMECQVGGRSLPVHLQQDYLQRPASRECEVIGDNGKVIMDLAGLELTRYGRDGLLAETREWQGFDRNQLFLDQARHFLECVETRCKPLADLADGVWSLRMALAAKESIARRCAVEMEDANVYATHAAY
jgi:predicted dehydrogenase